MTDMYSITQLAKISGVSTRTLRYYEECGLLAPSRSEQNHYRSYGSEDVDRLQQILFFRELGVGLEQIRQILVQPDFDPLLALEGHLVAMKNNRNRLNQLIRTIEKTIKIMKEETVMEDTEKFEGFKQNLITENERQYGEEIREKYGEETVLRSNARLKEKTPAQLAEFEKLDAEFKEMLKAACIARDPGCPLAQRVARLHKQWLCFYWGEAQYSPEAHIGIVQMYVDDPRFTAYYDNIALGSAVFLRDAVRIFVKGKGKMQ